MGQSDRALELLAALVGLKSEELHFVLRWRQLRNTYSRGHVIVSWEGAEVSWEAAPEGSLLGVDKGTKIG